MDNKLTETGSSNRRVAAVPIWVKPYLTIEEAAEYTGIGRDKLYEMTSLADCPFVLWVGNRRMIKRRFLMNTLSRCIQYDGGRMDEKILAYRSEIQKRSENTPFWTRTILTVEEAAAYTGIGRAKIRQIISQGNCPFTVNNGTQICVIREAFIDYLDKQFRI